MKTKLVSSIVELVFILIQLSEMHCARKVKLVVHQRNLLFTNEAATQPTFTCSKSTIEPIEKCVKYVQS